MIQFPLIAVIKIPVSIIYKETFLIHPPPLVIFYDGKLEIVSNRRHLKSSNNGQHSSNKTKNVLIKFRCSNKSLSCSNKQPTSSNKASRCSNIPPTFSNNSPNYSNKITKQKAITQIEPSSLLCNRFFQNKLQYFIGANRIRIGGMVLKKRDVIRFGNDI